MRQACRTVETLHALADKHPCFIAARLDWVESTEALSCRAGGGQTGSLRWYCIAATLPRCAGPHHLTSPWPQPQHSLPATYGRLSALISATPAWSSHPATRDHEDCTDAAVSRPGGRRPGKWALREENWAPVRAQGLPSRRRRPPPSQPAAAAATVCSCSGGHPRVAPRRRGCPPHLPPILYTPAIPAAGGCSCCAGARTSRAAGACAFSGWHGRCRGWHGRCPG